MSDAALSRIDRARSLLISHYRFYGVLASYLKPIADASCGTMATDGEHLFYSPEFVMSLPENKLLGVMAHEAKHCAYGHPFRIGDRDMDLANQAADYAINRDILADGFELPDGVLVSAEFGPEMSFEEIYSVLKSRQQKQEREQQESQPQQGGQDQPQDGESGKGDAGDGKPDDKGAAGDDPSGKPDASGDSGKPDSGPQAPGESDSQGKPSDDAGKGENASSGAGKPAEGRADGSQSAGKPQPGKYTGKPATGDAATNGIGGIVKPRPDAGEALAEKMERLADEWQTRARQAAAIVKAEIGEMPGNLARMLSDISTPVVDYREVFARIIDSRLNAMPSFMRPDRRFVGQGVYLPGPMPDAIAHLIFVIDTSGSVSDVMGENAISEVQGALDGGKVERVTVLHVDTHVRHVETFERGETIPAKLHGGGGTRFAPAFEWIIENAPDASAVVYLTDMECLPQNFGRDPGLPVAWAIHGESTRFEARAKRAKFGDAVYVGRLI